MQRADREGAKQIYHLNLLKAWKEVVAVSLVSVDQEKDELGPEVPIQFNSSQFNFIFITLFTIQDCYKAALQRALA